MPGKVQSRTDELSNAVHELTGQTDRAAGAISGHFPASGKDDDGKSGEVTNGKFSGVRVSPL
jgi:hypothetical protein